VWQVRLCAEIEGENGFFAEDAAGVGCEDLFGLGVDDVAAGSG
jgi:hypothetical protein